MGEREFTGMVSREDADADLSEDGHITEEGIEETKQNAEFYRTNARLSLGAIYTHEEVEQRRRELDEFRRGVASPDNPYVLP